VDLSAPSARRRQRGVSGMMVLAAIVLLGGLSAWAVGLASAASDAGAQAIAGARARQAAGAGIDWARWRLRVPAAPACAATQNVVLPGVQGNWTVTTRCTLLGTYTEGAASVRRWRVSADACNQPQAGTCPAALPSAGYAQASLTDLVER
jgi:MSHA biogenesis protein MshP